MSLPDTPNTLREKYYSVMAGQNDADILPDIETAPSTENRYLDYIARNGGGGGGDVTKDYVDEQDAKKTDKVTSAISGNFAGLDASGNLTDSGKKASDFATPTDIAGEEIISTATGTSIILTDSADGYVQGVTVKGHSEVVDGTIKSIGDAGWGVVDLGTLDFVLPSGYTNIFVANIINAKFIDNNSYFALCSVYNCNTTNSWNQISEKDFCIGYNIRQINIPAIAVKDSTYTDATAFKSAMSGILLYYPLADTTGATPIFGITSKNGEGQGTAATITTGLPYRSTLDGTVYDELTNEKVITRCEVVNNEVVPLATPTETPLTSAEKSALASLRTYDHTTYIDATDAPTMTVDYLLNTNNGKAVADIQTDLQEQIDDKITISPQLTLTVAGWDSTTLQQTVTFAHDTTKRNVIDITPSETETWAQNGVYAYSETASGITFKCSSVPSSALTFKVTSMEVG